MAIHIIEYTTQQNLDMVSAQPHESAALHVSGEAVYLLARTSFNNLNY
ncbi:MAG TPA: hypothetical protein VFF29_03380 [Bacteroidota bacterium]|nr:hypothetical protein [Bacteroidota bacterium]